MDTIGTRLHAHFVLCIEVCTESTFWCVLCWEVCPLSECPLSEVNTAWPGVHVGSYHLSNGTILGDRVLWLCGGECAGGIGRRLRAW